MGNTTRAHVEELTRAVFTLPCVEYTKSAVYGLRRMKGGRVSAREEGKGGEGGARQGERGRRTRRRRKRSKRRRWDRVLGIGSAPSWILAYLDKCRRRIRSRSSGQADICYQHVAPSYKSLVVNPQSPTITLWIASTAVVVANTMKRARQ